LTTNHILMVLLHAAKAPQRKKKAKRHCIQARGHQDSNAEHHTFPSTGKLAHCRVVRPSPVSTHLLHAWYSTIVQQGDLVNQGFTGMMQSPSCQHKHSNSAAHPTDPSPGLSLPSSSLHNKLHHSWQRSHARSPFKAQVHQAIS